MSWIVAIGINSILGLVSAAKTAITSSNNNIMTAVLACVVTECVQNLVAVDVMDRLANKPYIAPEVVPEQSYAGEWAMGIIQSSAVKGVAHYLILNHTPLVTDGWAVNPVTFIATSFAFELAFDFVHYWLHRGAHAVPAIYRAVHKKHHRYHHPRAQTAFYMSVADMVATYCIPLAVGVWVVGPVNKFQFGLLTTYLTYQEIGGHLGKRMAPTTGFPQFIWLPRWLGIELYTEDHDLHHAKSVVNYSKRFKLWDVIFGTYQSGVEGK